MSEHDRERREPEGSPGAENDPIGALLKASGRRPAVPAQRAARVRRAAEAEWRETADRAGRRRRRWQVGSAAAALGVAASILLVAVITRQPDPLVPALALPVARIEAVAAARALPDGAFAPPPPSPFHVGDPILPGMDLETGEVRIALRTVAGPSLRLDAATRIRFLSATSLALEEGAVYVDSGGAGHDGPDPFVVRTPHGEVLPTGTQFEARLDASRRLLLRVREGSVRLTGDVATHEIAAGFELALDAAGEVSRRALPPFDPAWAWIEEVTPLGDLDGRVLGEFLALMARERGLRLEYDPPGLAVRAGAISLSGSVRGMTLDEALISVLQISGMEHTVARGAMQVSERDPSGR